MEDEAAPPSPESAEVGAPPPPHLDALVERWWEDHFPGSAVARYTEAWNVAHSAKEALKALLAKEEH